MFKIAYFVDGRMPSEKANGYQSAQMCQAFVESGNRLTLLMPTRKKMMVEGIGPDTTIRDYYHLRVDLECRKLFSIDFIHIIQGVLKIRSRSFLAKMGSLLTSYTAAISLCLHIIKSDYDIIYIRSVHALVPLTFLLPRKLHRKVFFELHHIPDRAKTEKNMLKAFQSIGGVIALTEQIKKRLVENHLDAESIFVSHDGVDLGTFDLGISKEEARDKLGIRQGLRIASYIGKFHTNNEEKGIPEIISCAKYLFGEYNNLYFYFVGGPVDRIKHYEQLIESESLPRDRFVFIDKQPVDRVPYYLKASDVLLMPFPWSEHYAYYMSPLKMFEYMASQRPIIATDLPSVTEILRDGENALLAEAGNPKSIAQKIGQALMNDDISLWISGHSYQDVQNYDWSSRARNISDFMAERSFKTKGENGRN